MFSIQPFPQHSNHGPFRGTVQLISRCPLCQTAYQPTAARVLAEHDDAHLVHFECGSCQGAIVAIVMTNVMGVSSIGLVTDLTPDDVLRFRTAVAVSPDDVLALHEYLGSKQAPLTR